jgi:hypothetical protein
VGEAFDQDRKDLGRVSGDRQCSESADAQKGKKERRILPMGHVIDLFKADPGPGPFLQSKWTHDGGCDVDIPLQF